MHYEFKVAQNTYPKPIKNTWAFLFQKCAEFWSVPEILTQCVCYWAFFFVQYYRFWQNNMEFIISTEQQPLICWSHSHLCCGIKQKKSFLDKKFLSIICKHKKVWLVPAAAILWRMFGQFTIYISSKDETLPAIKTQTRLKYFFLWNLSKQFF